VVTDHPCRWRPPWGARMLPTRPALCAAPLMTPSVSPPMPVRC